MAANTPSIRVCLAPNWACKCVGAHLIMPHITGFTDWLSPRFPALKVVHGQGLDCESRLWLWVRAFPKRQYSKIANFPNTKPVKYKENELKLTETNWYNTLLYYINKWILFLHLMIPELSLNTLKTPILPGVKWLMKGIANFCIAKKLSDSKQWCFTFESNWLKNTLHIICQRVAAHKMLLLLSISSLLCISWLAWAVSALLSPNGDVVFCR